MKFIPNDLAEWIDEWLAYADIDDPNASLWPAKKGSKAVMSSSNMDENIVGALAPYVPDRRCSAHTLRHLTEQLAYLAGMTWLAENRELLLEGDLSGLPANPQIFADVLLDHALDSVSDTYKDINSELGRATWSKIAAAGVWDLVWGDEGARKGLDLPRVRESQEVLRHAKSAYMEIEARIKALKSKKKVLRSRVADDGPVLDVREILVLTAQVDAVSDEIFELNDELLAAQKQVDDAQRELDRAKEELVPVDDEAEPILEVEELPALALADRETEALGTCVYVRDWVNPKEFQWAVGGPEILPDSTLRRYMDGKMPFHHGDRRNLWDPPVREGERPPCILRLSERKRRILVERLDLDRYHPHVIARLEYLRTLPEGAVFTAMELAA